MSQPHDAALEAASHDNERRLAPHHPDQPLFLAIPRGLSGTHVQMLGELARYLVVKDGPPPEPSTKTALVEMQAFMNIAKTKNGGGRLEDCRAALLRSCAVAVEAIMVLDERIWAHTRPGAAAQAAGSRA